MKYNLEIYDNLFVGNKIKNAIDYRYSNLAEHKRRAEFTKDYDTMYTKEDGASIGSSLKQWIPGRQKPSIENLMRICNVLDCDIDYFLTEQTELKKEIANASDITGLSYNATELLNIINNEEEKIEQYFDKCIIFLIDFLLQDYDGLGIFWNMFHYLFNDYNYIRYNDEFTLDTIVHFQNDLYNKENDVSFYVRDITEKTFYNNITTELVKLKEKYKTQNIDTSTCKYKPSLLGILQDISNAYYDIRDYKDYIQYKNDNNTPIIPEELDTKLQELIRKKDDLEIKLKKHYGNEIRFQPSFDV